MKICCVTYKDTFSSGNKALNDLRIGHEHRVVGCGSKVFGSCTKGDLVLINAVENGVKHAVIGVIQEKLDVCNAWQTEGGMVWPYNFSYRPVTSIFTVDPGTRAAIKEIAERNNMNEHNVFNSRFCSIKCKEIIDMLIERNKWLDPHLISKPDHTQLQ